MKAVQVNLTILIVTLMSLPSSLSATIAGFESDSELKVVAQSSTDQRLDDDLIVALEIELSRDVGKHEFTLKFEGDSGSDLNSLTSRLDSGSAPAENTSGSGSFILTEFYFNFRLNARSNLSVGLLDPGDYLGKSLEPDSNSTDSDEVADETLALPDYTIGIAYQYDYSIYSTKLLLSSSHGIDDNNNYRELFNLADDGKGIFFGAEFARTSKRTTLAFGGWRTTARQTSVATDEDVNKDNYGVYINTALRRGKHEYQLRTGWSNPRLSEAQIFTELNYKYRLNRWVFSLEYGHTRLSRFKNTPEANDMSIRQLVISKGLSKKSSVSFMVRNVINNEFITSSAEVESNITIFVFQWKKAF